MSVRRRVVPAIAPVLLTVLALVAGCTLGPSSRPDLAVYGGRDPQPVTSSENTIPLGPGGPGQQATLDPGWKSCTDLDAPIDGATTFTTECAGVAVPVDYATPDNGTLTLDVARARAAGLAADAPTLVVLFGDGPYDATLAGVARIANVAAELPAEITATYQIVSLDVRGTGGSARASCWQDYPLEYLYSLDADLTAPNADTQLLDVTKAFTFGCQDHVGPEMVFYGTTQVADDLDSLRSALGTDTLDFLGTGYGATLGAVYATRYPGRVGRVVLDSPTDHAATPSDRAQTAAVQYERALQAFLADCATRSPCALGSAPAETVTAAIASIRYDPNGFGPDGELGSGAVLWAMVMALPDPSRWEQLAEALGDAADGDASTLGDLLTTLLESPAGNLSTRMMIDCNDTDERISDSDLAGLFGKAQAAAPTFGSFLVGLAALCSKWPSPDAALGALRAEGAPPLLVIGGVNDPEAPYVGAQAVASQLASATLISYQGVGHGGYRRTSCISAAADAFLLNGTVPAGGTLCPA